MPAQDNREVGKGLPFKVGHYRHYKGEIYYVLGIARHSETGEAVVIYIPLYVRADNVKNNVQMFVRPLSNFLETVGPLGVPRFDYIGGSDNA